MAVWGTKNPPKKEGMYLVTVKTPWGTQVRQATRDEYPKNNWRWCVLPSGGGGSDVIAWKKCPEPYKEK